MKFYKNQIEIFDVKLKKYGGHSRFMARIFAWRLNYLSIGLCSPKIGLSHEEVYYDGYHNCIWLGIIQISYGT